MKKIPRTNGDVRTLGAFAADAAIKAGGPDPFDADGDCLLPVEPMDVDWDFLDEQLGHKADRWEQRDFADSYSRLMSAAIDVARGDRVSE